MATEFLKQKAGRTATPASAFDSKDMAGRREFARLAFVACMCLVVVSNLVLAVILNLWAWCKVIEARGQSSQWNSVLVLGAAVVIGGAVAALHLFDKLAAAIIAYRCESATVNAGPGGLQPVDEAKH